jgi:hypothetical protein
MIKHDYYETQNLYEASFLLAKGFQLAGKERRGNKTAVFFDGTSAKEEALKYYNGGKVEAKAYSDAYRTLKDYVFER